MYQKKERIISFAMVTALSVFLIFYLTTLRSRVTVNRDILGHEGIFDLKKADFNVNKLIGLEGEVEFYWNQLLTPNDFQEFHLPRSKDFIHIPGIWNSTKIDGIPIGGYGYATYRFRIELPEDGLYALKIKEFENAYKIWVNGELLTETGIVGRTKQTMEPSWRRKLVLFKTGNKFADVVIQISNFQHRKGGADTMMIFGKADDVSNYRNTFLGIELFLFGVLFILSTYHIVLYVFRTSDKSYLFFSIICFLMLMRLITTGEKLILEIIPEMNWLTTIKLEYLSYKISVPFFMLFLYHMFKNEVSLTAVKWTIYVAVFFSIIVILFPPIIFTYTPLIYQGFIAIAAFYILYFLIMAYRNKRENALIFLISFITFSFVIINDILFYDKIINTGYLLPYGMFVLAYAISIVISKNVALAFWKTEQLSIKLDQYNKALEKNVEDRTEQIRIQNNELEKQAKILKNNNEQLTELSAFKESLTEMIIHDLKNPLNIVLNFSKDDRVIFAGNQMLNLVHNLLDVQRYENSLMRLNIETVSVQELLQNAIFQMNFLIKEKDIQLTVKQSKDYLIAVDPEIINRVFVNLLSNALKFTPIKGKISIFIKEKMDNLSICFADSGPGIPKDQKNVIFEKFGQFIIQRAGRSGSTGLGLTFCKMAIEAHHGEIDFTSVLGKGATFCCTLPKVNTIDKLFKPFLNKTSDNKRQILEMEFSIEERIIMSGIAEELLHSEIYEIGKIKKLIKEIDDVQSDHIKLWISEIQKAILNSDNEFFKILLDKIK